MFNTIIQFILDTIETLGYFGIFFLMAIESSVLPLPSEIVMIPAGYLVWEGKMNLWLVIFAGTFGSLAGALCNYFIAMKIGRILILRYGNYFFIKEKSLNTTESFFKKHGEISTFIGRLIPVIRHYISLPAGLAKMNLWKFCFFTLFGAFIWVSILTGFGWWLGDTFSDINMNEIAFSFGKGEMDSLQIVIKEKMHVIVLATCLFVVGLIGCYLFINFKKKS